MLKSKMFTAHYSRDINVWYKINTHTHARTQRHANTCLTTNTRKKQQRLDSSMV